MHFLWIRTILEIFPCYHEKEERSMLIVTVENFEIPNVNHYLVDDFEFARPSLFLIIFDQK